MDQYDPRHDADRTVSIAVQELRVRDLVIRTARTCVTRRTTWVVLQSIHTISTDGQALDRPWPAIMGIVLNLTMAVLQDVHSRRRETRSDS